jgi:hypothetical protein
MNTARHLREGLAIVGLAALLACAVGDVAVDERPDGRESRRQELLERFDNDGGSAFHHTTMDLPEVTGPEPLRTVLERVIATLEAIEAHPAP